MKAKLAFEIFITAVVLFDAVGYDAKGFPVWEFFPMWVGSMVEIEVGTRAWKWLWRRIHSVLLHRSFKKIIPMQ